MTCPYTSDQALDAVIGWSNRYGYSEQFKQFAIAVMIGESGMNPCAVGDNGQSHGIYQFYTNGGRGTGIPIETLRNPYWEAEHNLQPLHAAFEKYGGDSAWGNDPYTTLKLGWKYGQGSVWPSDKQLRDVLGRLGKIDVANFNSSWPEPSKPSSDTQPSSDSSLPSWIVPFYQQSRLLPSWIVPFYQQSRQWPEWLVQNAFSGLGRQPVGDFIQPIDRQPVVLPTSFVLSNMPPPPSGWDILRQML